MRKRYTEQNVYEAFQDRLAFLFDEFENVFVSFSGGKDSSLLLHLVLDYVRDHCPHRRIGVFHQDFEAQYSHTTQYVTETFQRLRGEAELYWVCLPMATRTAVGNHEIYWYPWDDTKKELWVRPMPQGEYVINLENNPISTYQYRMHQEDLSKQFGRWYAETHRGRTVCLLGLRSDESLNRYNSVVNRKNRYKDQCYVTRYAQNYWTASPLYDWSVSDVWHAYEVFGYPYNSLYDLYYKAGVLPEQMRVASPFNEYAVESLNLYRIIDPETWTRLVGRVRGANFASLYAHTKAMGKGVTLPENYTWEEYTKFLLATLPPEVRRGYIQRFCKSIEFWHQTGGGLSEDTIAELEEYGYRIVRNGVSNYTLNKNHKVIFLDRIPDETDHIRSTKDIPSWKRMCLCILKNDHLCRSMGFGMNRTQKRMVEEIRKKYAQIGAPRGEEGRGE